jgi:hypothetical protein
MVSCHQVSWLKCMHFSSLPPLWNTGLYRSCPCALTKHQALKAYWGGGGTAPRILDLGTRQRWVVSFTPRPLYPQANSPATHWTGGWAGLRASLDAVVKRKIPSLCQDSNHPPTIQTVAQCYTTELSQLLTPLCILKRMQETSSLLHLSQNW